MTTEERVAEWKHNHGYGLSEYAGRNLVELHKKGTDEDKAFVEALFTDLNFHEECRYLKNRNYIAAYFQFEHD